MHLIFLLILFSDYSQATVPDWASRSSHEDDKNYYFVGRGDGRSESEAYQRARSDALSTAIRELFGFSTRIMNQATETNSSASFQSKGVELSQMVKVKSFKEINSYTDSSRDLSQVWILYQYPKTEALAELDRLSKIPDDSIIPISMVQIENEKQQSVIEATGEYSKEQLRSGGISLRQGKYDPFAWAFLLFGSYYEQMTETDSMGVAGMGLLIEKRFFPIGIRLGITSYGKKSPTTENPDKSIKGTAITVSMPYYFFGNTNENIFLEPSYGFYQSKLNMGRFSDEKSISQQSYGVAIGGQFLGNDPASVELRVGINKFLDTAEYNGAVSGFISIGIFGLF